MTKNLKINLKLYKADGLQGYDSDDLGKWMKDHGLYDRWRVWFNGQTVASIKDKMALAGERIIVYKHDVDHFLSGKLPLD